MNVTVSNQPPHVEKSTVIYQICHKIGHDASVCFLIVGFHKIEEEEEVKEIIFVEEEGLTKEIMETLMEEVEVVLMVIFLEIWLDSPIMEILH